MNEKEQKQQNNLMKTTVGVTVGKIVEASTTKDVDQSLIEVSFSSCQRNLIKTFQIEAMIALNKRRPYGY